MSGVKLKILILNHDLKQVVRAILVVYCGLIESTGLGKDFLAV